jgi:hypothetical protein
MKTIVGSRQFSKMDPSVIFRWKAFSSFVSVILFVATGCQYYKTFFLRY